MLGAHADMVVPDAVSPAIGWRTWSAQKSYGRWVLVSPSQGDVWPHRPGQYMQAHCQHSDRRRAKGCDCGINAFASREQLSESMYAGQMVWGEVKLWGEVHEFEQGLRGECASPGQLHVSPHVDDAEEIAEGLARTYGVKVSVKELPGGKAAPAGERSMRRWEQAIVALCAAWGLANVLGEPRLEKAWREALDLTGNPSLDTPWMMIAALMVPLMAIGILTLAVIEDLTRRHRWMVAATALLCLAALPVELYSADHYPGKQGVQQEPAIAAVRRDGKTRRIKATAHNKAAWTYEYINYENGQCRYAASVDVCRKDDVMTFTSQKAQRASEDAQAEREAQGQAAASAWPEEGQCRRMSVNGQVRSACMVEGELLLGQVGRTAARGAGAGSGQGVSRQGAGKASSSQEAGS
jgi:hypothetical protein